MSATDPTPALIWQIRGGRYRYRKTDPGPYVFIKADLENNRKIVHRVELTASPTGRNVHVYVDGKRYEEAQR